ncbi:glycosyltransferase family 4 protein [Aestuariibacter sp. AA17]|uniref:Glycosyltransferase family 4 protein n=1 Tax=Fluctibacter corallii TaxID=2984329 RepID=A0ABT3ADD7_9ALTE|nr:glycosyltransferase family 4 protein [Aestuariibacter sp. AA17]MCV2886692.1 glycosyltransferase family 4 protein [Aestuariibacter sp. AA17]
MKIALMCNEYPPQKCGGIGIFTKELAETLVNAGHTVHVVGAYSQQQNILVESLNGVVVHRLPARQGLTGIWKNSRVLFQYIKSMESQLDMVEVPDFEGLSAFWGKLAIPCVIRLHGTAAYFADEMATRSSRLISWMEKRALKQADAVIAVSDYVAKRTEAIFSLNLGARTVYNGVKIDKALSPKCNFDYAGSVIFTGSLMRKKGVFSLAESWKLVKQAFPDAALLLVGKDTQENGKSVKQQIIDIVGPSANVRFTGHVDKSTLQQYMKSADVAVFPSFSESFGLAPFEAMALGVPTVYTKLSCGPELLEHEHHALLVNPHHPEEIASTLILLLRSQALREKYSAAGYQRVQDFSVEHLCNHNIAAYQAIMEDHHAA